MQQFLELANMSVAEAGFFITPANSDFSAKMVLTRIWAALPIYGQLQKAWLPSCPRSQRSCV